MTDEEKQKDNSDSESNKTEENTTPKDSEIHETPEEKKIIEKAKVKIEGHMEIVPVTEEPKNKEEQNLEQSQEEMTVITQQTTEQKTSEEAQKELEKQKQDEERYFEEHIAKDRQEPRSEKEGKDQYVVKEQWNASKYLDNMMETEVKVQGITKNDLHHRAMLHYLKCAHSGKEFLRDVRPYYFMSICELECSKCKKVIPEGTLIQYRRPSGRVLCPECWSQGLGDKATLNLTQRNIELQNINRVYEIEIKQKAEKIMEYRDKEALHEMTLNLTSLWKLSEPNLRILNSVLKQYYTNQNNVPPKFAEYVNSKVGSNAEGGRRHFLSEIANKNKDPQEELLKICEQGWIQNKSQGDIGKEYQVDGKTIYRVLKDLESMKEQILEFIKGKIPEIRKPLIETFMQTLPKIHELYFKGEEQATRFDAILKAREFLEKYRRRKMLKEQYSEEA